MASMTRWRLGSLAICAIMALYASTALNLAFWRYVWRTLEFSDIHTSLFAFSIFVVFFLLAFSVFSALFWPYVGKFAFIALLLVSSVANHFMFDLNVYIDLAMLRNVIDTDLREASETITSRSVLWLLGFGVLPAILLAMTKTAYRPPFKEIGVRFLMMALSLLLALGIVMALYKDYSSIARNNKQVSKLINPYNYIEAAVRYVRKAVKNSNREFVVLDADPRHTPYDGSSLTVLIIVVGETARAGNFSLNGYERKTNPLLSKQDIISFPNVASCDTATATSLPCMFSHLPRTKFDEDDANNIENLLDILQKSGYDILWLDNNTGSKGVARRVPEINLFETSNLARDDIKTNFDAILLDGLEDRLAKAEKNTVIVLHTLGSHGPSYYRRYPDAFKVFTPGCETAEVQSCSREEIVNTYDNTILYTDYVLSETIDILKKFPKYEAGMFYVSDHGESLGENGIYLHGLPYSIAPAEQKQAAMILWMSEAMKRQDHIDYEKLRTAAPSLTLSHDNFFHTVLGLMEIDTKLYSPDLDMLEDFRTKELPYAENQRTPKVR